MVLNTSNGSRQFIIHCQGDASVSSRKSSASFSLIYSEAAVNVIESFPQLMEPAPFTCCQSLCWTKIERLAEVQRKRLMVCRSIHWHWCWILHRATCPDHHTLNQRVLSCSMELILECIVHTKQLRQEKPTEKCNPSLPPCRVTANR